MSKRLQYAIARAAVGTLGVYHALLGLVMIVAPEWFFENIGNYPPYSQHYVIDFGAYQVPLGIALIFAARHPFKYRLLVGSMIVANILHAFAHVYDDLATGISITPNTVNLLVIGFVYVLLLFANPQTANRRSLNDHHSEFEPEHRGDTPCNVDAHSGTADRCRFGHRRSVETLTETSTND